MYLLAKSRAGIGAVLLWVASIAVIIVFPNVVVPVPNFSGTAPLVVLFVPSLSAACVSSLVASPLTDIERMSARPIGAYIMALLVGATAAFSACVLVLTVVNDWGVGILSLRSYLAYIGIGLIGSFLAKDVGPALPILVAAVLGVAASPADSFVFAWAVSLETHSRLWLAPMALACLGGIAVYLSMRWERIP